MNKFFTYDEREDKMKIFFTYLKVRQVKDEIQYNEKYMLNRNIWNILRDFSDSLKCDKNLISHDSYHWINKNITDTYYRSEEEIEEICKNTKKEIIGVLFSGGFDSTYLLIQALEQGYKVLPIVAQFNYPDTQCDIKRFICNIIIQRLARKYPKQLFEPYYLTRIYLLNEVEYFKYTQQNSTIFSLYTIPNRILFAIKEFRFGSVCGDDFVPRIDDLKELYSASMNFSDVFYVPYKPELKFPIIRRSKGFIITKVNEWMQENRISLPCLSDDTPEISFGIIYDKYLHIKIDNKFNNTKIWNLSSPELNDIAPTLYYDECERHDPRANIDIIIDIENEIKEIVKFLITKNRPEIYLNNMKLGLPFIDPIENRINEKEREIEVSGYIRMIKKYCPIAVDSIKKWEDILTQIKSLKSENIKVDFEEELRRKHDRHKNSLEYEIERKEEVEKRINELNKLIMEDTMEIMELKRREKISKSKEVHKDEEDKEENGYEL